MKKIFKRFKVVSLLLFSFMLTGCLHIPSFDNPSTSVSDEDKFSVSFDLNGGTLESGDLTPLLVAPGATTVAPTASISKEGEQFLCWSLTNNTANENPCFVFESETIQRDLTLYATYQNIGSYDDYYAQPGYLYLHYRRANHSESEYDSWGVWIWPREPRNEEGVEIATYERIDDTGAIYAIDITKSYPAGKQGLTNANFSEATKIGFLIVYKTSMRDAAGNWTSGGMWQSDSGGDVFIDNIASLRNDKGAIHIFCTENNSVNYVTGTPGDDTTPPENPYDGKEPGSVISCGSISADPCTINSSDFTMGGKYPTIGEWQRNTYHETPAGFEGTGYQIQVSSYADSNGDGYGDLNGITNHLDYISDLGIKVIWLTPFNLSNSYHAYDVINFYEVDPRFGTKEDYKRLVATAHDKGMKVIMDLVLNHMASNSKWFQNSSNLEVEEYTYNYGRKKGQTATVDYRNFFQWRWKDDPKVLADPYPHWYQYSTYGYYYYGSFASNMPELNYDYQGTREAVYDIANYWIEEFDIDGFRLDAVKHIYMEDEVDSAPGDTITDPGSAYRPNLTKNLNFFNEFVDNVSNYQKEENNKDIYIVGENFDGNQDNTAPYLQTIDTQFDFTAYYNLKGYVINSNASSAGGFNAVANAYSKYVTERSRFGDGTPKRYVGGSFTSNHDVNRAINTTNNDNNVRWINKDLHLGKAKAWASIILTMPGLVWVYYGDEIGLAGNVYINENATAGTEWSYKDRWWRQMMKFETGPVSDTPNYFIDRYQLVWDPFNRYLPGVKEQTVDEDSILNRYKGLIALRNSNKAFTEGGLEATHWWVQSNPSLMVYQRSYGADTFLVYINVSPTPIDNYCITGGSGNTCTNQAYLSPKTNTSTIDGFGVAVYKL